MQLCLVQTAEILIHPSRFSYPSVTGCSAFLTELHQSFFPLWQMARSAWKQRWRTRGQDVMERPFLHLYWLSVSASETTSDWTSHITHYIKLTQRGSVFSGSNCAQYRLIKLLQGSNGCAVCSLSDLQHTKGPETLSYIFQFGTWLGEAYLRGGISVIKIGLVKSPYLKVWLYKRIFKVVFSHTSYFYICCHDNWNRLRFYEWGLNIFITL